MELLEVERQFLQENRERLVKEHDGNFLVIRGTQVHGAYGTLEEAVMKGAEIFGSGPFLAMSPTEEEITASVPALAVGVPLTCQL